MGGALLLQTRQWPQINSPLIFGKSRTQSRSICNQSQSGFWPCLMSTSSTQKNGSFNNLLMVVVFNCQRACWSVYKKQNSKHFVLRPTRTNTDISACMFCLVGNHLSGGGQRSDYHLQPFHWISTEPLNGNLGTSCK